MRLTIKAKLAAAFTLLVVLTGAMASVAIYDLNSLNDDITDMVQGPVAELSVASDLSESVLNSLEAEKNVVLNADPTQESVYLSEIEHERKTVATLLTKLEASSNATIKAKVEEFKTVYQQWLAIQDRIRDLGQQSTTEARDQAAVISMGEGRKMAGQLYTVLDHVKKEISDSVAKTDEAAHHHYETSKNILVTITVSLLLIAIAMGTWISLSISRGLAKAVGLANAVAIGDLGQHVQVSTNDEIKDLVDAMTRMTTNLNATAALADAVASGDLSVEAKRLSDKDTLGIALQNMITNLKATAKIADSISNGDLTV
jgi:methyl-accepting chemotaxis protein